MDELDLLRPLRAERTHRPDAVVDATLERARARVVTAVTAPARTARSGRTVPLGRGASSGRTAPPGVRPSRNPLRRPPVLVVGAAAAAVALGVTGIVTLDPGRHGAAEAAGVLDRAADAAVDAAPARIAPGTYLEVQVREEALGYVQGDGNSIVGAYRSPVVTTTWIPADQAGTWVQERYTLPATTTWGGAAARRAAARDYAVDAHRGDPDSIRRAQHGAFTNGELGGTPAGTITTDDIPTLPRDPHRLLTRIEDASGDVGATPSQHVVDTVTELLRSGLVPADLQSAMYRTLALLPDIRVTHDRAVLDGRTGTGIGLAGDGRYDTDEIVVDDRTGTYIGERSTQAVAQGPVPAGTTTDSTSVRISVVDRTP